MLATEILLHDVVYAVGNAGECLLHGKCESIDGVDERHGGEHQRREIGKLVVGLGARYDCTGVVFRACGCQCDDIDNRNSLESGSLARYDVPGVSVRAGCSSYCLCAVEHATAAHGQYDVDALLLAYAHTFYYAGIELGVRLDARQLIYLLVVEQLPHLIVKTASLDASAAIGD